MNDKKYTVVLVPEEGDKTRSFYISQKGFRNIILFMVLIVIGLIIFSIYYLPKAFDYDRLKGQNTTLMEERLKVASLLQDLRRMQHMEKYIRQSLGVDLEFPIGPERLNSESIRGKIVKNDTSYISFLENIPSYIPVSGFITQDFSEKSYDLRKKHHGIDIAAPKGEAINAAASGIIVFSGWTYNYGNFVIIYHGDDYFTFYGHNQRNLVAERQVVDRGEVIGLVGETGVTTGPHLHFEIWKNGQPVDPKLFINEYRIPKLTVKNND